MHDFGRVHLDNQWRVRKVSDNGLLHESRGGGRNRLLSGCDDQDIKDFDAKTEKSV